MENAQSQTVLDVKELRNQHNSTRRKLERLERDVEEVGFILSCCRHSSVLTMLNVSARQWRNERKGMPDDANLKEEKEKMEHEQRAKNMEVCQ
jgi:hypothetical protein